MSYSYPVLFGQKMGFPLRSSSSCFLPFTMLVQGPEFLWQQKHFWGHGILFSFKCARLSFNFCFSHHQHEDTWLSRLAEWFADRSVLIMLSDCVKGCESRLNAKVRKYVFWRPVLDYQGRELCQWWFPS